jgi:hypothetical protein
MPGAHKKAGTVVGTGFLFDFNYTVIDNIIGAG